MTQFIGNCSDKINWDELIINLEKTNPSYIGPRHRAGDNIIGLDDISKKWEDAGYKTIECGGSSGWDMFLPGVSFSNNIIETFCNIVNITPHSAWISRLKPGMYAPPHWDANDEEERFSKIPDMVRFSCHVSRPADGHVFMIDDQVLYNQTQGNIYQWNSRKSWHGGANAGLTNKYLFNIFGNPNTKPSY